MALQPQNVPPALASSSTVAWICLLTITAATAPGTPLRVVNNSESIVSRGMTFEPYPFEVTLPTDDTEQLPQVTLSISNLDAAIIEFIRGQTVAPNIGIELVTSAYPDIVEKSLTFLKLVGVTYDAMVIQGRLDVDDFLTQRFPAEGYVPPLFPGAVPMTVAEASAVARYVGIPYLPMGRTRAAADCWGVVLLYAREVLGLDDFPDYFYPEQDILVHACAQIGREVQGPHWHEVGAAPCAAGMVHIFRIRGYEVHCGIHVEGDTFLHSLPGRNSCVEFLHDINWRQRRTGTYVWTP